MALSKRPTKWGTYRKIIMLNVQQIWYAQQRLVIRPSTKCGTFSMYLLVIAVFVAANSSRSKSSSQFRPNSSNQNVVVAVVGGEATFLGRLRRCWRWRLRMEIPLWDLVYNGFLARWIHSCALFYYKQKSSGSCSSNFSISSSFGDEFVEEFPCGRNVFFQHSVICCSTVYIKIQLTHKLHYFQIDCIATLVTLVWVV